MEAEFMFYDNFINLCEDRGVSPTRVLNELKISKGALANWKGGGEPLNETKKKLADYLGITIKQLISGELNIEKPTSDYGSGLSTIDIKIMDKFTQLTPDQKKLLLAQVEAWIKVD